MKQQQNALLQAKKLSRSEMKKLQGGLAAAGLWVCTGDDYRCFRTKALCQAGCSVPTSCQNYMYCP